MTTRVTPLHLLKTTKHQIPSHANLPNTSISHKPLLIYHSAFSPATITASAIEQHLRSVDVVAPQWRYTMYSTTHFHSTTHEVLCVSSGKARLVFGGERNPARVEVEVEKGDVMVVPAGLGHRLLEDVGHDGGFEMVGSYPKGYGWDMCYGDQRDQDGKEGVEGRIKGLEWFAKDPIYGEKGPVLDV